MDLQKVKDALYKVRGVLSVPMYDNLGLTEAIAELEKPAEDVERAYLVLEVYGVPRGRAKTLANGIDVLETRYRKDRNCFENEKQQYAESYHAKKCAECKKHE